MQKDVIKKLLQPFLSYDELTPPNVSSLMDQAANNATDGEYDSWQSLVDAFMEVYDSYSNLTLFLLKECGIDLTNEDSGSIIGIDAGGSEVIEYSPVYEVKSISGVSVPTKITMGGFTLVCPSTNVAWQQNVYKAMLTWWLGPILAYIEDAYGFTFIDFTATVEFIALPAGAFAAAHYMQYPEGVGDKSGKCFDIKLQFNSNLWCNIDFDSIPIGEVTVKDISSGVYYDFYPDAVLLHEITHLAQLANAKRWWHKVPSSIIEGTAEIVTGADWRDTNGDVSGYYVEDISNRVNVRNALLSSEHAMQPPENYTIYATFLRWLAKKFNNSSDTPIIHLTGTPFLNKLLYSIVLYDKLYADVTIIINLAIQYATKLTGIKTSYTQFIQEYVNKLDIIDIDKSLLDIANIDFTNDDDGAYGGMDSKFVDYVIKRHDRFRILSIYSYLNQADTLYYSFSYYAKYDKSEYKVRDLTIRFTEITSSTINAYYKKSIISRLIRGVFKPVLQCLDYYLNLRFDSFSFCKIIHIDFDDDPTPIRPCSYQVSFDESGKVNSMLITFYTYAYIPIDDRDTMPAMGYYTGNYLLYIFCILVILSKLKHADLFYKHPIIVAIAIALVGYDELGEADIKQTAVSGKTEEYAVGGIVGD